MIRYYLESSADDRAVSRRHDLASFPAIIGRTPEAAVQVNSSRISRQHARIDRQDDKLILTDLGSTNGTFVNHEKLAGPKCIEVNDVLHFADVEYRLMADVGPSADDTVVDLNATVIGISELPSQFPLKTREFLQLMEQKMVCGFRQGIHTARGELYGVELLGRSTHPELSNGPAELFAMARALGMEVELSRLLRRRSFEQAATAGLSLPLFFNTHPAECKDFDGLLAHLSRLRKQFEQLQLVFEVHEAAVTDLDAMAEARESLEGMNIALAYDDFGAGQARLLELVEVPPDYLKFDIALVRNLDRPGSAKYRLLDSLSRMIGDLGIHTIAEGVETEETLSMCRQIGLDYIQGFVHGRPEPLIAE